MELRHVRYFVAVAEELHFRRAAFLTQARPFLQQAEHAREAAQSTRDGVHAQLRIGYVPASLPAGAWRAVQRVSGAMPQVQTILEPGSGLELLDAVRNEELRLEAISPERIVVLQRDASKPFYDAALAACQRAGLAPKLVQIPHGDVERLLLAVAAGAGIGLLPESMSERHAASGIRFVRLDGDQPAVPTDVATCEGSTHMVREPDTARTAAA